MIAWKEQAVIARALRTILLALACLLPLASQGAAAADEAAQPKSWSKEYRGNYGGESFSWRVDAGETFLPDDKGAPKAAIFSIAYTRLGRDGSADPRRPLAFLYNGGPGSASLWLHMGGLGPRRVVVPSDAADDAAAPFRIVDNEHSILDVADLVFIDPVGTGFSRPLGEHKGEEFYGIHEDAASIAEFIRLWLDRHGRWNSPKFIGGESYGTTRSAALVHELESRYNDVALNGILLISTILDFSVQDTSPGNEMAMVVNLPTMAATAWYHDRIAGKPPLGPFLEEVRAFARTDFIAAMLQGDRLAEEERARIRARLAAYTGLSESYLEASNLRVQPQRFMKELLRDRGLTVGRLDSRYTGVDYDAAGERPDNDPSFYGIDAAYTAAVNDWLRREIGVDLERPYSTIGALGGTWKWDLAGQRRPSYRNVAQYIGTAMRENSALRVFNAAGYFDFATPFHGAEYALTRNGVVPERIVFEYYEAGHMMYVHEPSLEKLANDLRAFIRGR